MGLVAQMLAVFELFFRMNLLIFFLFKCVLNNSFQVPIYKGASEAIIPIDTENTYFYGRNGFGDLNIWKPSYPKDVESIIQRKHAVEIIRELVLKVKSF